MNNINEIKEILMKDLITQKVKEHSINKSKLNTYLFVGERLNCTCKEKSENINEEYSLKLLSELGNAYYDFNLLKDIRLFYLLVNEGMKLSYYLSWDYYKEIIKLEDIELINLLIHLSVIYNLTIEELKKVIKYKKYNKFSDGIKKYILDKDISNIVSLISESMINCCV